LYILRASVVLVGKKFGSRKNDTNFARSVLAKLITDPEAGRVGFDALLEAVRATGIPVATGQFGADMQVQLVNDGPVTVIVDSDAS
jgi:hypothetical protein